MAKEIMAGVWKTNVTPPVGISMEGSFFDIRAEKIVDELYASAVVIDDGIKEIAIVSVDVCTIPDNIFKYIADRIEHICGISKNNIIIAATHTHNGPKIGDGFINVGEVWDDYVENFKKCVATAVIMAKKRKQPVKISVGRGKNENYIFNRRLKKPDGSIVMNWIDKTFLKDCTESGPVDPEITFIRFEDKDNRPIAFIVNYANHNNAMCGSGISADWSGHMRKVLAEAYGEEVVSLFLPGACGNVNWINYKDFNQGYGQELVKEIGTSLAGTVMENTLGMEYPDIKDIDVLHKKILVHDRPFSDYDTKEDFTFGAGKEVMDIFSQYRKESQFARDKELPVYEVDIHAIRIGEDIVIVTNPGELFSEFGFIIKTNSPFKYTFISELTNGSAGYICTKKAFDEGGYEVRKAVRSSHLEVEAGEKIVDISIELLKKIR
jgi:Predicted membrane protein